MNSLSAVLITCNAANQLPDTLAALSFAQEIIVLDSGSTDDTVALCQASGATVIHQAWLGFGPQKQMAISLAKHDWVLCVDSDEVVSPRLRNSIQNALKAPSHHAYRFARCNYFMGRYLRHGEGYPDYNIRLFNRQHAQWSDDAVHEHVLTHHPVGTLKGDLLHHSADTLRHYLDKQNRYTDIQAQQLYAKNKPIGISKLCFSPLLRFIKFYFVKLGFLDGVAGLVHISIGCFNSFSKYAKTIEKQKQNTSPPQH